MPIEDGLPISVSRFLQREIPGTIHLRAGGEIKIGRIEINL